MNHKIIKVFILLNILNLTIFTGCKPNSKPILTTSETTLTAQEAKDFYTDRGFSDVINIPFNKDGSDKIDNETKSSEQYPLYITTNTTQNGKQYSVLIEDDCFYAMYGDLYIVFPDQKTTVTNKYKPKNILSIVIFDKTNLDWLIDNL